VPARSPAPPSEDRRTRIFVFSTFREVEDGRNHLAKFILPRSWKLREPAGVVWGEADRGAVSPRSRRPRVRRYRSAWRRAVAAGDRSRTRGPAVAQKRLTIARGEGIISWQCYHPERKSVG
jgi:hypothetical protein